ncbi:hypothetical protein NQ315_001348 [Exocentrus adspersus]|uniref:Fibronectin type-III domain-containing protein n=1 Tax=Exocentrus adspersus TaxID=1586481 RepID=A0AAV8WF28_9CUCU|nr:hypothetical protein NQ315_001348 [Exocentrus adspersus]
MSTGLLLLLSLSAFIFNVNGEDCIAGVVRDLNIDSTANLTWAVHPTEPCQIDQFLVEVASGTTVQFRFYVNDTHAHLPFLDVCQKWMYVVTPITEGVLGYRRELTDYIPLPPDTDLTVNHFMAQKVADGVVHLQWNLTNPIPGNCFYRLEYRLVMIDLQSGDVTDTYIRAQQTNLHLLSPCVPYELSIRAINTVDGVNVEGPSKSVNVEMDPYPEDPPTLSAIETTPTGINMVWTLESYLKNRCPVINFFVDGGSNFNITQPIRDHFGRAPVAVNLTHLQPDRMYYFKVLVENLGGMSPVVPMAAQTLELKPSIQ